MSTGEFIVPGHGLFGIKRHGSADGEVILAARGMRALKTT
jgi:hypothetical protein